MVIIVTSGNSHVTKQYIYLYVIHVMYVKLYIYLHRMRYNPGKIVTHGCKLHV